MSLSGTERKPPRDHAAEPDASQGDRRTAKRHLALVVARICRGLRSQKRTALTRDLSVSGALVLTRAPLQLGEVVELELLLSHDDRALQVPGRVVRMEKLTPSERHLWAAKAAVAFDRLIDASEPAIEAIASAQQRQLGRSGPPR